MNQISRRGFLTVAASAAGVDYLPRALVGAPNVGKARGDEGRRWLCQSLSWTYDLLEVWPLRTAMGLHLGIFIEVCTNSTFATSRAKACNNSADVYLDTNGAA